MTLCPGKHDPGAMTGPWARDLDADLRAVTAWGGSTLITLMEQHELELLKVTNIGPRARSQGLDWYHLPIKDASIPPPIFEERWERVGRELRERLLSGQSLVIHCRGGLGRTGVIAAWLLIDLGEAPRQALARVRRVRPGAVETAEQEEYVLGRVFIPD